MFILISFLVATRVKAFNPKMTSLQMSIPGEKSSLVIGLNGALQRRVAIAHSLNVGSVNRATAASSGVGGKGQGAWVASQNLWTSRDVVSETLLGGTIYAYPESSQPRLVQFYGSGDEGNALVEALRRECPGTDEMHWRKVASKTRICTTLCGPNGEATEIVEPSGGVTSEEGDNLLSVLSERHDRSKAGGVLFMGTMPPGLPSSYYASIVDACADVNTRIVVDSVVGLDPLLAAVSKVALSHGGDVTSSCLGGALLKVNGRELLQIGGKLPPSGSDSEVPCDHQQVASVAASLSFPIGALSVICWTDGPFPGGAYEVSTGRHWVLKLPPLPDPVMSPVGAGDATAAATFHAWQLLASSDDGMSEQALPAAVRAFTFGLACGGASCLTSKNSEFNLNLALSLFHSADITEQ